jgi:hypothetical protein
MMAAPPPAPPPVPATRALATFGRLRAMLAASAAAAGVIGLLFATAMYGVVKDKGLDKAGGGLAITLGVLSLAMFVKTFVEVSAVMRLRGVPNVPIAAMPGFEALAKIARVWLAVFWVLFAVAAVHLVYVVAEIVVVILGFVAALIVTLVTLFTGAKAAFSLWWDVVVGMAKPWDWEAWALAELSKNPAIVVAFWIVLGLVFAGPTLIAGWIHARRALFAAAAQPSAPPYGAPMPPP